MTDCIKGNILSYNFERIKHLVPSDTTISFSDDYDNTDESDYDDHGYYY